MARFVSKAKLVDDVELIVVLGGSLDLSWRTSECLLLLDIIGEVAEGLKR